MSGQGFTALLVCYSVTSTVHWILINQKRFKWVQTMHNW
jgi:hypothetical protein